MGSDSLQLASFGNLLVRKTLVISLFYNKGRNVFDILHYLYLREARKRKSDLFRDSCDARVRELVMKKFYI